MTEMTYKKCIKCMHVKIHYKGEDGKKDVNMPSASFALICKLSKECIYVEGKCPDEGHPKRLNVNCSGLE